jgi:hypothetical protein
LLSLLNQKVNLRCAGHSGTIRQVRGRELILRVRLNGRYKLGVSHALRHWATSSDALSGSAITASNRAGGLSSLVASGFAQVANADIEGVHLTAVWQLARISFHSHGFARHCVGLGVCSRLEIVLGSHY